eukprot:1138530-Pelagomonas_calceolata.AAC.4
MCLLAIRYDSHRDQILRSGERHQAGASAGDGMPQKPADEEDLYQYFTSAAYSGYGDGPKVRDCVVVERALLLYESVLYQCDLLLRVWHKA